jgi:N-acetylmuramoyl-L-alanine amidase
VRQVDNIFIHCTAGYGDVDAIRRFWREELGWKQVGYHYFVYEDGSVHVLAPIDQVVNGVRSFNANSVHIAYQGGVLRDNLNQAADTRSEAQKATILHLIRDTMESLKRYQPVDHVKVIGHRDASPDRNGNGIIEPWERIKECPSFDAVKEYRWTTGILAQQINRLVWKPGEYTY